MPLTRPDTGKEKLRYAVWAAPVRAAAAAVPAEFMLSRTTRAPFRYTTAPSSARSDRVAEETLDLSVTWNRVRKKSWVWAGPSRLMAVDSPPMP